MPKNEARPKATRKPLRDISNGAKLSKSVKKKAPENEDKVGDDALDRLALVHSDLSALIHQIDELVVQALKLKVTSKKGMEEIETFAHLLSDLQNSLKPWALRFLKALSSPSTGFNIQSEQSFTHTDIPDIDEDISDILDSPDQNKLDSMVSPSPLVSWQAGCTTESGRQLFLLTPLPRPKAFSSKLQKSSKLALEKITLNATKLLAVSGDTEEDLLEEGVVKSTPCKLPDSNVARMESIPEFGFVSPTKFSKRDCSMLVMTPCLKMSPPKSCVLLEPISEISHKVNLGVRKSTPFPLGVHNFSGSRDSESSSSQASQHLSLRYPELFGIKPAHKLGNGQKLEENLPDLFMSPPRTCVLMEPPSENSLKKAVMNHQLLGTACILDQKTNLLLVTENGIQGRHLTNKCNQEHVESSTLLESTPMWKEPESTIQFLKCPGENTLKKELWTKFEAASNYGIRFNASLIGETSQKGFLDRLDEVSCDETSSVPEGLR